MRLDVKIEKTYDDGTPIKALCSATFDGMFAVHGIRLRESQRGWYITMPFEKYKDKSGADRCSDIFHPITLEARKELEAAAVAAYKAAMLAEQ